MPTVRLVDAKSQTIDKLNAFDQGQGDALSDSQRAEIRKIINFLQDSPEQTASNAGRTCYEPDLPVVDDGKKINVKERLWTPGHHTTLEHADHYYTFEIDGVSVSDVTFGLHMPTFYDSDQRSGRYSKMYDMSQESINNFVESPDFKETEDRIKKYYPGQKTHNAMDLIKNGIELFHANKDRLAEIAGNVLRDERPNVTDKYIAANSAKMAQEQLRVFISTSVPTAMYYTINLPTLVALQTTAWTPGMKDVVNQMVTQVLTTYPSIDYMFKDISSAENMHFCSSNPVDLVCTKPYLKVLKVDVPRDFVPTEPKSLKGVDVMHHGENGPENYYSERAGNDGLDLLHFSPKTFGNDIHSISTSVKMSVMTMGQDQRHRTLHRGIPVIGGEDSFYLPPLLKLAGLEKAAKKFSGAWCDLMRSQPFVANYVIPYGARVGYDKASPLNGLIHEQEKRECSCAQEEIGNMNLQMVQQLANDNWTNLVTAFRPMCAKLGKCIEGKRYCGRDISEWKKSLMVGFRERQI